MIDRAAENNKDIPSRKTKRILSYAGRALLFLLVIIISFLYWGMRYLLDNWSELSMDELIFHFKSTLDGTNPEMIRHAILRYALPAALIAAGVIIIFLILRNNEKLRKLYTAFLLIAAAATLFFMKSELDRKVGLTKYIVSHYFSNGKEDFIAEHYVNPESVKLEFPSQKRNLIYIYLESAEITYADKASGGAFEKNVIPELTALARENEDFSGSDPTLNGGIALTGATWTIGAMFAQTTGLPLKVPINGNEVRGDSFFPGITALGDILEKEGYRQELLLGSKATFGGRSDYFGSHGNYEIRDYNYALSNGWIPEGYKVFWGYEDEKLFQFARNELTELAAGDQPFNLTLLTVDSHFEDGYRCRLCRDEFGEQYADVFACSSRQVDDFVHWIKEQDFYENTTVIVCGDHLTMDKDFCIGVPDDYQRKTIVSIINPVYDSTAFDPGKRREYDTFDLFPTTLASLNVKIPGNRLGLGVNLFSEEPTLIEQFGYSTCDTMMGMPSAFMDRMSGVQVTQDILDKASADIETSYVELKSGATLFIVAGLKKHFNFEVIDGVEIELTDKTDGSSTMYDAELRIVNPATFNYFCALETSLNGRNPEDYEIDVYITVGDFKHYKLTD